MSHKHTLPISNPTKALTFFVACSLAYLVGVVLNLEYAWSLCLGLAYMYPYNSHEPPLRYFSHITGLALLYGVEVLAITKTNIIDSIIGQYRNAGIDSHVATAICVVLLLTPIIQLITTNILRPVLENKISPLAMKILAATLFGIFCTILNKAGVISFIVKECREWNLDAHLIALICITLILGPINNILIHYVQKTFVQRY